tara:strand:+ start:3678 stop:3950 length:273 start_codon:yes stop_codon:yes gene_type:complete
MLLTVKQACKVKGCATYAIRNALHRGEIDHHKEEKKGGKPGSKYFIYYNDKFAEWKPKSIPNSARFLTSPNGVRYRNDAVGKETIHGNGG